jgi:hypothetical protein
MIALYFDKKAADATISALMSRYSALPRHIAKKHLQAVMKRTLADGIPVLRRHTPPMGARKGRKKKGDRSTGALRRAATTKAKFIGRNTDGVVYGVLGFKYGFQSRKAIWMENGTVKKIAPHKIIQNTLAEYGQPSVKRLTSEMASALEKATRELEANLNPTRKYEVGGGWTPG